MDIEEIVRDVIEHEDQNRMDIDGGYPSDWVIQHNTVYWATVGRKPDNDNQPLLIVISITKFLEQYNDVIEELKEQKKR